MIFSFPVSPKKSDAKSRQTRAYVKTNYPRVHLFLLGTLIKDGLSDADEPEVRSFRF